MQLYYHPDLTSSVFDLSEEESAHLKVLRLQIGAQIHITDGKGNIATAVVEQNKRKQWTVRVIERKYYSQEEKCYIDLVISPLKNNERIEWLLEKATEMGVRSFTLVFCTRTERKLVNEDRLKKIIVSAAKQSQQLHFPELHIVKSFAEHVHGTFNITKFIAYCGENTVLLNDALLPNQSVQIVIGPEGDFTDEEMLLAQNKGYRPVSLGESRLRSETAGLFAVASFKFINQL